MIKQIEQIITDKIREKQGLHIYHKEDIEEVSEDIASLIEPHSPSFYRQLFREMPNDRTFTSQEIADMFEIHAPYDPDGIIKEGIKKMFEKLLKERNIDE